MMRPKKILKRCCINIASKGKVIVKSNDVIMYLLTWAKPTPCPGIFKVSNLNYDSNHISTSNQTKKGPSLP